MWNNFYWNNKKSVTNEEKVFFAKYSYTLGDGAKYFSVYYKDKDGKDVWAGYTNASNVKALKSTEESKYVTLKKDYNTWNNLYFKQHKDDFKASKGVNFKVKRYYTLNGNKFYSTYRVNGDGKEVWTGYVNGYSSVVSDLKATEDKKVMKVTKDYNTYENHFYTKKGQVKPGSVVTMERYYTYGNGKKYASVKDKDGKWLGYVNMDALKVATLETADLEKAINSIKDTAKNVYMTKDQEAKAKDALEKLVKAIPNKDYTSQDEVDAATKAINDAVKAMNDTLPNKEDGTALNNIIDKANQLDTAVKGHGTDLFDHFDKIAEVKKEAQTILDELKKDKENGENTATVEETKEAVKAAMKALNDALKDLTINKENTDKYVKAATDAIGELNTEHKDAADEKLAGFKAMVEHYGNVDKEGDYKRIIDAAKALNEEIHQDQKDELQAAVNDAKEVAGTSDANKKFYTDESYKKFQEAEQKANITLKDFDNKQESGAAYVEKGKEAATDEKAIESSIKALDVKDWTEEDKNGEVVLTRYTGDWKSTDSTTQASKTEEAVIEVPGMLKGKQTVLGNVGKTSTDQLFPESTSTTGQGTVTVKFEEANGHKVKAGKTLECAFYANKRFKSVDVTGLDTSSVSNFRSAFNSDFFMNDIKDSSRLVTSSATDLTNMFRSNGVKELDATKWDTSHVTSLFNMFESSSIKTIKGMENWDVRSVTDFNNMFGSTVNLTQLNFAEWDMEKGTTQNTEKMFISPSSKTTLKEVILPGHFNGSTESDKLIANAIQNAGKKSKLQNTVTLKTPQGKTLGTIDTKGEWQENKTTTGDTAK